MILAFSKRGRGWARVLSLLLLCNSFLHLCCHEHLGATMDAAARGHFAAAFGASDCRRHSAVLAVEFFCPCCSAVLDWFADTASAEIVPMMARSAEIGLTPFFPGAAAIFPRRSRAPPLA